MISRIKIFLLIGLVGFGLTGCSGHPGSGNWGLIEPANAAVAKVLVHFEGRAELIDAKSGEASHHCFWGGKSDTEMQLDCTTPQDTETRLHYTLTVEQQDQMTLTYNGQLVGRYKRLPM
ncbi:MAG: hypothetical protein OQK19_04690 [Sedimenticola sp.]|nr:hypothetical protein [Sedimenticola sp.]MCW8882973.1 hypothetical protein [Sedimenticola sp.]MCW8920038.1 hypothetical protein [Sedimenticola sp.]MCW8975149.1 hypothetical protein [Sedimenticola sp.]